MKKNIVIVFVFIFSICKIYAQATVADTPFDLLNKPWETTAKNYGTIKSNNNFSISYNNVRGADDDVRIFQKLLFPMPNSFVVSFYFTVTDASTAGAALLPIVFTAGNLAPSNPDKLPAAQTNQDALGILLQTPLNNKKSLQISPYVKVGNAPQVDLYNNMIKLEYNKAYAIQLKRCNATKGNITVKLKEALIGSIDFVIPNSMGALTYMQAANLVQASQYRNCSAVASIIYFTPEKSTICNTTINTLEPVKPTAINTVATNGIVDYEDLSSYPIEKLGPSCCQLEKVQYGEYRNGYITEDWSRGKNRMGDCSDVLYNNRSIVFPGRRTIKFSNNVISNDALTVSLMDTVREKFEIYKNKKLTNKIDIIIQNKYTKLIREEFSHLVNGNLKPLLTNKYFYEKPLDDFPQYCISYKNGDSSRYLKISYFGKKRNINSFTVFNSETNNSVNYTLLRDKNKYTRFYKQSPLHYYVGLQTPENPNPILNVFAFAGDMITDIIPDAEIDGAKRIHFDQTYVKNRNSHLTSMRGTNGTDITFQYDCDYSKPIPVIRLPEPPKETPKETTPIEPPKVPTKTPKNVMDPKEMGIPTTIPKLDPPKVPVKTPKDGVPTDIPKIPKPVIDPKGMQIPKVKDTSNKKIIPTKG